MKIVYNLFSLSASGGVERVITNKANALVARGHQVTIVTTDQGDQPNFYTLDERVEHIDLGLNTLMNNATSRFRRQIDQRRIRKRHKQLLSEVLFRIRPDIAIATGAGEVPILHSIQDGSKKILEFHYARYWRKHNFSPNDRLGQLFATYSAWDFKRQATKYDKFVTLTHEDALSYGTMPNITSIPNAKSFETEHQTELNNPIVMSCGRLQPQKNFGELIDIWGKLMMIYPDSPWRLQILGDGYLRDTLQKKIETLGLEKSVELIPATRDIISYYCQASVFALSPIYEGFGMVLLEANTCGVPAVSYACKCGPRDIIEEGKTGFLVEPGDQDTFAERLKQLMEDADLRKRMGAAARISSERFSEEIVMDQWEKLFTELVQK